MFFFFFREKIKKHVKHSLDASEGMKSTLSKYKCPYVLKVFPSSRQWYGLGRDVLCCYQVCNTKVENEAC